MKNRDIALLTMLTVSLLANLLLLWQFAVAKIGMVDLRIAALQYGVAYHDSEGNFCWKSRK